MELYLQECKKNVKNADENTVIQVVLGNESCDLDSAVSTIVFAYYLFNISKNPVVTVPVLNVKRCELPLRKEVIFFLEQTSICLEDLICINEIDIQSLQSKSKLSVVLVDHNSLSTKQSYLKNMVIQIIDHHAVENPEEIKKMKTKIEPVGSCCTLVAEEILESNSSIMDPQIAMLLYGTILLDTIGLKESAKRVTGKDKEIIIKLEQYLTGVNRDEVFETLQKIKFDVSELTPEQMLYKDTKYISENFSSIALVSLPILLQDVVARDSFVDALKSMATSENLCSIILQGLKISQGMSSVQRQLAIYSTCPQTLEEISNHLLNLENPSLGLVQIRIADDTPILLYEQENIALTRKFVLPAMQRYLKTIHTESPEHNVTSVSCFEPNMNSTFKTMVENSPIEDNVPSYLAETVDFPDSPNHSNLLRFSLLSDQQNSSPRVQNSVKELKELGLQDDPKDTDSGTSTLKRIRIVQSDFQPSLVMEEDDDDRHSLSSISNEDAFSQSEDIILDDDDAASLDDIDQSDCELDLNSISSDVIPEMSAAEEFEEDRSWKDCVVNGEECRIDMKVIEPYRKVLSHGGYESSPGNAIIVFSACYLPDRSRKDYDYVMDNLFLYVITSLDELVAENYVLVYLHGATERGSMPSFSWLRRCYQMINRKLRKNLKGLYLVHPTFWLKTIVIMTRPFISSKFSRKLQFVYTLKELFSLLPLDHLCIPDKVKQLDFECFMKEYFKEIKSKKLPNTSPLYITYMDSLYAT